MSLPDVLIALVVCHLLCPITYTLNEGVVGNYIIAMSKLFVIGNYFKADRKKITYRVALV